MKRKYDGNDRYYEATGYLNTPGLPNGDVTFEFNAVAVDGGAPLNVIGHVGCDVAPIFFDGTPPRLVAALARPSQMPCPFEAFKCHAR